MVRSMGLTGATQIFERGLKCRRVADHNGGHFRGIQPFPGDAQHVGARDALQSLLVLLREIGGER
jgi:hypothetical protein